jgi:hypothetical protein
VLYTSGAYDSQVRAEGSNWAVAAGVDIDSTVEHTYALGLSADALTLAPGATTTVHATVLESSPNIGAPARGVTVTPHF